MTLAADCSRQSGASASSSASSARSAGAPGATGSTSAARRARSRSRSATTCRNCWRASSPGAASRSTRSRLPRSDRARADAGSRRADRHAGGGGAASPTRSSAARQIAIFGDYDVDGATVGGAAGALSCATAGSSRIIHIPDRLFEGYGPNVEAIRALAARGATLLVTVDCGTTSIEPLAEARKLGLDVDRHRPSSGRRAAAAGARGGQSEPARRSFGARPSRRRRARVHDRGRGQPRAAHARLLDASAAGARSARLARSRRARHRRRRGAAQGPQPRLRRQGPARAAPARERRARPR